MRSFPALDGDEGARLDAVRPALSRDAPGDREPSGWEGHEFMSQGSPDDDRQRLRSVLALGLVLALVFGGVWLFTVLRHEAQLEDCLASGRRDCDRLVNSR